MTRFGEILQLCHNFKLLDKKLIVFLVFGKILIPLWLKCYAIGQVFIDVDDQIF